MIVIAGKVTIKPGTLQDALKAARIMEEASEAEPGCLTYRLYPDPRDETQLFLFEVWENQAALSLHGETPHMAAFNLEIPKYVNAPMQIKRYDVSAVSDL